MPKTLFWFYYLWEENILYHSFVYFQAFSSEDGQYYIYQIYIYAQINIHA